MPIQVTERISSRQLPCVLKWMPNPAEEGDSSPVIVFFYEHADEIWGINLCATFPHPCNAWINIHHPQWVPTTVTISSVREI